MRAHTVNRVLGAWQTKIDARFGRRGVWLVLLVSVALAARSPADLTCRQPDFRQPPEAEREMR